MAVTRVSGVRMAGVCCALPDSVVTLDDDIKAFGEEHARRVFKNTGIKQRYITRNGLCASDLCAAAAKRLLDELHWGPSTIDAIVFVTQTPDYIAPPTACVLQKRLGLPTTCAAFDVNLGCSGYVYGLWMLGSFFAGGGFKRALLLAGDTITRVSSPQDRSVAPIFSDAGSATALEADPNARPMGFVLGTDGGGARHLMIRAGALRHPGTDETARPVQREDGSLRSDEQTYMNGAEVFTFTLKNVPGLIKEARNAAGWQDSDVDAYVFHQASSFMLKNLQRSAALPADKFIVTVENRGNTSSVSIPLAICDGLAPRLTQGSMKLLLAGFGVGWSWAASTIEAGPVVIPPVVMVKDVAPPDPLAG